ncbi:RCC1 domain-containing protein [Sorangium sp. So ce426]|uniref:RCC1 domain-containing protein n=1 Tax=Sorangium sp. So ce426 TaxID=3133312 RepID=UPI003F5C4549
MPGATVVLVAAVNCNQVADIRRGDEGCLTVADCKAGEPACRTAVACQEGVCVFEDAVEGKPLPEQTAGDCAQLVCDGAGSAKQVPLPADVPDDRDICTIDGCDGTAPVHTLSASVPCYNGPDGTEGVGVCRAGLQRCDDQGRPVGSCDGEVTPQAEVCDSGSGDEDCDGETNENGEDCACGDGWVSAGVGEECDDGGTIDGDGCAASCVRERVVQIEAGQYHTCAVLNTRRIKCWGWNNSGQLGIGDAVNRGDVHGQMGSALPVTDLGTDARVESLAMGGSHTCARLTSGAVKCWGGSRFGALGLGENITLRGVDPSQMGDNLEVVNLGGVAAAIAAGGGHTCALVSGDVTRCWGWNAFGQLGLGDGENRSEANGLPVSLGGGKVALSFALGERHTCARMNGGSVKCWGYNVDGQLGIGDTVGRGDDPDEMGNGLSIVDLGGESTLAISAGLYHACARMSGGSVKCWGHNAHGQLGMGDRIYRGTATSQMGDNLSEVKVGEAVTALAAGGLHTCALLASRRIKCWGDNDFGQLGLGHVDRRGDDPDEMGDALPTVDLGEGATAAAITAGAYHTCALLTDGHVKCWGRNHFGQLGLGDAKPRGHEPGTMGDALPAVELFKSP